ncbi:hypothetical protein BGS_0045 [Beggiatoa sp. SS]|nr:hypothetical protein BGS_0045 [Beggiatoa sp. SS]
MNRLSNMIELDYCPIRNKTRWITKIWQMSPINQATGLGVQISAFSGRDHRPELLTSDKPHTVVSPVSMAEHKIRHDIQGGNNPDGFRHLAHWDYLAV